MASKIIISSEAIAGLAKALGIDFNKPHNGGYMGPDNEEGLFTEAVVWRDVSDVTCMDDNGDHYIIDEEKFVKYFADAFHSYKAAEQELPDDQ